MVLEFVVYHRKFGRCATCASRFDWFRSSSEAEKKKKSRMENPDRGDLCYLCSPLAEDARVIHRRGALRVYRKPGEVWSGEYTADGIARRLAATTKSRRSRDTRRRRPCRTRFGRSTERRGARAFTLPALPSSGPLYGSCNFRRALRL